MRPIKDPAKLPLSKCILNSSTSTQNGIHFDAFEFLSLSFSMCHFLFACCFFAIWHCHFHFWLFDECVCVCVCESFRAQECLLTTQALHTILTYIARNVSQLFFWSNISLAFLSPSFFVCVLLSLLSLLDLLLRRRRNGLRSTDECMKFALSR